MTQERERRSILITEEFDGERVDSALAKILELSRSTVADLLNSGDVLQGKKPLSKSDRLQPGDRLTVVMPAPFDPLELRPTPIEELEIVYDDDDVVVVNKPVGCAAHASPGWTGPTVVGALIARGYRISTSGPQERQGIVQRLDAGTSGLMLLAKNETSYNNMKNQFRNRTVKKVYHTLVQGHVDPSEGTIDAPIGRHPREDYRFAVVADENQALLITRSSSTTRALHCYVLNLKRDERIRFECISMLCAIRWSEILRMAQIQSWRLDSKSSVHGSMRLNSLLINLLLMNASR